MKGTRRAIAAALVASAGLLLWWRAGDDVGSDTAPPLSVPRALGEATDDAGFARATQPRAFDFPGDHGPHPEYRNEWWYFTGNLSAAGGRRFGYQLTFFRIALSPIARISHPPPAAAGGEKSGLAPASSSAWRTNQAYLAHFALTDVDSGIFRAHERMQRGAAGLAGAQAQPFRVWLDDWFVESRAGGVFPLRLTAGAGEGRIDLRLEQGKPVVLPGEGGLSRKSGKPGNASYYYSLTRMPTSGSVAIDGETYEVEGTSWMDREWSTSALAADQVGWDWFALQLSDRREIMFYRLRRRDGSADPYSAGVMVTPDGRFRPLAHDEVAIEVLDTWRSPHNGGTYPSRWRLTLAEDGLRLEVNPLIEDQEVRLSAHYWEGAVSVRGTDRRRPLTGVGYVELVGYATRR